ncbi:MAG: NusA-like transcription termination signal-binding factor [Nitrososphaerota archaeon]
MNEGLKLTDKEIRYISLFEAMLNIPVIDCIENEELIVFVIENGKLKYLLQNGGKKIKQFSYLIKKKLKIIEYSHDTATFIKNALLPAKVTDLRLTEKPNGKKMVVVAIDPNQKGLAIGKNGKTIELVRYLAKRHHNVDKIIII